MHPKQAVGCGPPQPTLELEYLRPQRPESIIVFVGLIPVLLLHHKQGGGVQVGLGGMGLQGEEEPS